MKKGKYQEAKSQGFHYKNDPTAKVDFQVGDKIKTNKEGYGEVEGIVKAINGQQLTCEWQHGIFYAWSWQSTKVS